MIAWRYQFQRWFPFLLFIFDITRGTLFKYFEDVPHDYGATTLSDQVYYYCEATFYLFMWYGMMVIYNEKQKVDKKFIFPFVCIVFILPFALKEIVIDEIMLHNNDKLDKTDIWSGLFSGVVLWHKYEPKSFHGYTFNLFKKKIT